MAYYTSSEITVFPSTSRVSDPTGKYTSEHNFINILNSLIDHDPDYSVNKRVLNDGCVLTHYNGTAFSDTDVRANKFCFIIHGYYFELNAQPGTANTYFGICVSNNDQLIGYGDNSSLDGIPSGESTQKFLGLFTQVTSNPGTLPAATKAGATNYWLQITDANSNLVNTVKFNADSIEYTNALGVKQTVEYDLRRLQREKQDNISAANDIVLDGTTVKLNDNLYNYLNSLRSTSIGTDDLDMIKVENGNFAKNNLSRGGYPGGVKVFQHVYVSGGTIVEGQTIYASQQGADDSLGNNGDIWYKYS